MAGPFSASLRRGEHEVPGLGNTSVKALEGKRIRVHGWIEKREGPMIDLSAAGLIEVVAEENAAGQRVQTRALSGGSCARAVWPSAGRQ